MIQIKICGLTQPEDVEAALRLGADMLGFIHVSKSPRFANDQALARLLPLAKGARRVVVVQDEAPETLEKLRNALDFEDFQFHGSESPETVKRWGGYKVFHMKGGCPSEAQIGEFGETFLLDTQVENQRGGTGKTFDWEVLPQIKGRFLVAGGLTPENVTGLVERYHPWGVDVSSGVEKSPGYKDHKKLEAFIQNIRRSARP